MREFYCVMSEFYDNGAVKIAITTRICRKRPKNTSRSLLFMEAFHDWYETRAEAEAKLTQYRAEGAA